MRILYVCADRGIPLCGDKGASVHVRAITAALSRIGHTVTVAPTTVGTGNPPPPVHGIAPLPDEPRRQRAQLADVIAAESIELVIERYSLDSGAAGAAADAHGLPLLLEVNAPLVREAARYRGLRDVAAALERERQIFASAHVIHVVSSQLRAYVQAVSPDSRVRVLPNGVDYSRFASAQPAPLPGRLLVGFVGSMKPWHGVMDLLDAFALVAERPERPQLVLVGGGPEVETARRRAQASDLAGCVLLLGPVPHDNVAPLVRRLDIAVAPYASSSDFYFSPLKLMEYMAASRPIVYPELGDLPRLLGDAGLSYPAGDVPALARRLEQLIGEPELREQLGTLAGKRAQGRAWERVADRLVSLVEPQPIPRASALARA